MILSKLRSRRGTSLIVALFLLIVCSTVGSIILTAATANVGRISERAEYDRKYYKVISAARLFADKIAESDIALTIKLHDDEATIESSDKAVSALSNFLQRDVRRIYEGPDGLDAETAARYVREGTFSNIGREAGYCQSDVTAFTMEVDVTEFMEEVRAGGEGNAVLSTVYGRFAVEAKRMIGDIHSGLDSVEHNVTAVFYSDEDEEHPNEIPESAYVVKLVCPAEAVCPTFQEDENGESLFVTFKWPRDNMKIEQVRGVA